MTGKSFLQRKTSVAIIFGALLLLCQLAANAQPQPPRPNKVYNIQTMSFGAIFQGFSGGTAIIYANGSRSSTGDVILAQMGFAFYPAIFEVEAPVGTIITLLNGPDATLSGSNGGTMTLHLGDSSPASPFIASVAPPGRNQVRIGGTLIVGNPMANPVGAYNGSFTVIFNQQ
jgi:hypothetical protein